MKQISQRNLVAQEMIDIRKEKKNPLFFQAENPAVNRDLVSQSQQQNTRNFFFKRGKRFAYILIIATEIKEKRKKKRRKLRQEAREVLGSGDQQHNTRNWAV